VARPVSNVSAKSARTEEVANATSLGIGADPFGCHGEDIEPSEGESMARSDSLRTEIARLQARKAMLATGIATSEKAAATAREEARSSIADEERRNRANRTLCRGARR